MVEAREAGEVAVSRRVRAEVSDAGEPRVTRTEIQCRVVEAFTGKCARCHRELPTPGSVRTKLRVGKWIDGGWAAGAGVLLVFALTILAFMSTVEVDGSVWLAVGALALGVVGVVLIIRNNVNHGGD